jgi:hypothetical protein
MVVPYRSPPDGAGSYAARWQGTKPEWLRGSVVRTCPAVFRLPGWQSAHLFDGLGAMFAFHITDEPRLDWRLIDCEASRMRTAARASRPSARACAGRGGCGFSSRCRASPITSMSTCSRSLAGWWR